MDQGPFRVPGFLEMVFIRNMEMDLNTQDQD